jgi:4-amino-4-deoxy-L-arabinose transferase-like glycosyltransferase
MSQEAWIAIGIAAAVVAILTFIGVVSLLLKVFRMRRHLGELGSGGKVAFWAAMIYTFLPIDLLPDPIYLDDMAVVGTALFYLTRLWRKRHGGLPLPHARRPVVGQPGAAQSDRVAGAARR